MADPTSPLLGIYLQEYDKLKGEQLARIGFRDNLIYVTIGAVSGVLSLAFANSANYMALLIVPWITLILGWTYLVNDQKVTAIGQYIRHGLADKIKALSGGAADVEVLGWEVGHRSDARRERRKREQLIIDEIAFVLPGLVAMGLYWLLTSTPPVAALIVTVLEGALLVILAVEIHNYADLAKGR